MNSGDLAPATLPPEGLPGLDSAWSRIVKASNSDGEDREWHILDNQVADPTVTLLCVHGNPTWSYLWRDLLASAPDDVRVIAVDQLDMGFSERTGRVRRMAQRISDLSSLTDELNLSGPIVTVAHDWGGPISLGWALEHRDILAGVVLMNTAVHQPEGSRAPSLIRMVRTPGVLKRLCESTPTFIRGTMALSRPRPTKSVRDAYEAPYRTAARRVAIAKFVEDIPLSEDHETFGALSTIAEDIRGLEDVPTLLLWGPSDPVFSDLYLKDLSERMPHASVHRFVGASHLLPQDADVSSAIFAWLPEASAGAKPVAEPDVPVGKRSPLWGAVEARADDDTVAIVEMGPDGQEATATFRQLHEDVQRVSGGMVDFGICPGDRVALLVPPGIDLAVCVVAAWRVGAVVVLVDAGLGAKGMGRALKSADPKFLIGIPKALAAAATLRWPGIRVSTKALSETQKRLGGIAATLPELRKRGVDVEMPPTPSDSDMAAIGFTSGATGPAKGVRYRHHQLQAQRDAIVDLYDIGKSDRLVAAFGPFALLGTLMGIPSVVPSMSVTSPGSLTAAALVAAVAAVDATLVFASPAALTNVTATARSLSAAELAAFKGVRLILSAGAPVSAEILGAAASLMSNADAHTPYGMTEVMPVADIGLDMIVKASNSDEGVCVGMPVPGVDVRIDAIASDGTLSGELTTKSHTMGEVCVRAEHMRDGYDKLWFTEHAASQPEGWHRTGDVGHLDSDGQLWIEGRIAHVIATSEGIVTPVGVEQRVSHLADVSLVAVVGVGPRGVQQVVVVLVTSGGRRSQLASLELSDRVRSAAGDLDIAAVLVVPSLPVDKRHNSKINRTRVAEWAEAVLAGRRMRRI